MKNSYKQLSDKIKANITHHSILSEEYKIAMINTKSNNEYETLLEMFIIQNTIIFSLKQLLK